MNKNRLTLKELKELKPSFENPIELVCDNGGYSGILKSIKVVGFHEEFIVYVNKSNKVNSIDNLDLSNYSSFKQEPVRKVTEVFDVVAIGVTCNANKYNLKNYRDAEKYIEEKAEVGKYQIIKRYKVEVE